MLTPTTALFRSRQPIRALASWQRYAGVKYTCLIAFAVILPGMTGCQRAPTTTAYDYGTESDSARFYFQQGWEQIMDYGQWTESERSFRKAVASDPDFIIGKSLVARISTNLDERLALLAELESQKDAVDADGRLLLDVYLLNVQAMNLRDQGRQPSEEFNEYRRAFAISNFGVFLEKYPGQTYIKAEYIESIHAVDGAQAAIESIQRTLTPSQKDIPFFLRYRSSLEAELGNYETALAQARRFEVLLDNPLLPEPYVLYAEIYHRMGRLKDAKSSIDKAVELDRMHLIARGLQLRIQEDMQP